MTILSRTANLLRYIRAHPVGARQPIATLGRIINWQVRSRLSRGGHVRPWIGGAKLAVEHGMTGATGNLYFGLHEFKDMAFMVHMLREGDLFLDIGANVGTYSVLAARVCGAETWSFEPDKDTAAKLARNLEVNAITDRATILPFALGEADGEIGFTRGLDAMNHVTANPDEISQIVQIRRLDDVVAGRSPMFAKIDVEGHEDAVFAGATAVLNNPAFVALEAETVSDDAHRQLTAAGFEWLYYDPLSRTLLDAPSGFPANNRLYVKDRAFVQDRLATAKPLSIFGWLI